MIKFLKYFFIFTLFFQASLRGVAEWSFLFYLQMDNNLTEYAEGKIASIEAAYRSVSFNFEGMVNSLVQIDYPQDKKTWRFRIDKTGRVEDGSLSEEMGVNPGEELVKATAWMVGAYPAKRYGIILMNHGSGTDDYRGISLKTPSNKKSNKTSKDVLAVKRGILYDDSEGTCLTNQALTGALVQIRENVLGRKIDFIGMDACLMAMVEVAYQMKDLVEVFVASEEVEAAPGWEYNKILIPVLSNPTGYGPYELGSTVVKIYGQHKHSKGCQSAMNMNLIDTVCGNINAVASTTLECIRYKSTAVRAALRVARANSFEFEMKNYIDLYTFYQALYLEVTKLRQDAENETPTCCGLFRTSKDYIPALDRLMQYLIDGMSIIERFVFANTFYGSTTGAHGVAICFPKQLIDIHGSYPKTLFVQSFPSWYELIKKA